MDKAFFLGRTNELRDVKESIWNFMLDSTGNALQLIQITGPPGIGKTSLAKQVSLEMNLECEDSEFQFKSHFVDLKGETRTINMLKQIGMIFGSSSVHTRGHKVIREMYSKPLVENTLGLLVLDGIEDMLSVDETCGDFLEFCEDFLEESPFSQPRMFILTTSTIRFQLPRSVSKLRSIEIRPLGLKESKDALLGMSGNVDLLGEFLNDLADCSEGFPIAILLIVAILKVGSVSPKELLARLRRAWMDTLISGDLLGNMSRVKSVISVCLESLPFGLRRDYPKLAFIPASFTVETAQFITSSSSYTTTQSIAEVKHDLLTPLHDRSLIDIYDLFDARSKPTRFHIHQFLRAFVEDKYSLVGQDLHEVRSRYCAFYGRLLLNIVPLLEGNYAKHLPVFQVEIRNIEKLLREAIHCLGEDTNIFMEVAYKAQYLIETFLPTAEAVEFYKACVNATQNPTRPRRGNKLNEARMLLSYGKILGMAKTDFELEYEQYMEAMRILRHRGDSLDMAMLLYSIAGNLHSRGMRIEALTKLHHAIDVLDRMESSNASSSQTAGPLKMDDHSSYTDIDVDPDTRLSIRRCRANTDYMIGVIYAWIGKTSEAEQHHLRSLQVKRELWGENHPSIGVGYNGLSLVYEKTKQPEKASRFCFRGLNVKEKFLKEPSIGMIVSLNNAARYLSQQRGEHQRALELLDRSYEMRKKLGLAHRDTSLIYNNYGKVYLCMGDEHNAMINFEKAVELRKQYLGVHASTAGSMQLLGQCYLKQGLPQKAIDPLQECLDIVEKVHMKEQPLAEQRANALKLLAEAHYGVKDLEKSEELYQRTLDELQRLGREFEAIGNVAEQTKYERNGEEVQRLLESVRQERLVLLPDQGGIWEKIVIVVIIMVMIWIWYDAF